MSLSQKGNAQSTYAANPNIFLGVKVDFGGFELASTDRFLPIEAAIQSDFSVRVLKRRPVVDTLG